MAKKTSKNGTLITTYPVLQGSGSKYTATNVAGAIKAVDPDMSVALIDLDFKAPYLAGYLSGHDRVHTIDNLIERIDGGFLDEESIRDNIVKLKNGVDLLKGTKLKNVYHFIKQEHIRQILVMMKRMYDVVIVAVSNGGDSLSATVSMLTSEHILLVGKNDYSNYLALESEINFAKNYALNEDSLKIVFNMHDPTSDLDFQPILSNAEVPLIAWTPFDIETINNKHLDVGRGVGRFLKPRNEQSPYYEFVKIVMEDFQKNNK